jgi:hypothetical protein
MYTKETQDKIFQKIQLTIGSRTLADELIALLGIGKSAAYRRIRCETELTFQELLLLHRHFKISLDDIFQDNYTGFNLSDSALNSLSGKAYLQSIEQDLIYISQFPETLVRYAASEVPLFYYLLEPKVAAFKLFFWSKTIWRIENKLFTKLRFKDFTADTQLTPIIKNISKLYGHINSLEIWNENMMDIIINQIKYCVKADIFEKQEDALELCACLEVLLTKLHKILETGNKSVNYIEKKKPGGTIQAWNNRYFQNNIIILVDTPIKKITYLGFDSPNFMRSDGLHTYEYATSSFNKIQDFSSDITLTNEVNRYDFFEIIGMKLHKLEKYVRENM